MIMGQTTKTKPPLGWRNTVPNFQVILTSAMCCIFLDATCSDSKEAFSHYDNFFSI